MVVDTTVASSTNLLCACNRPGRMALNANFGRDYDAEVVADIVRLGEGGWCRHCNNGRLVRVRAIELGNIFRLGDYYTQQMDFPMRGENGRKFYPFMGSYGIGIGRLMSAIVDANRDERGIVWPIETAPFIVYLMSIGKVPAVRALADRIYRDLGGIVLYDDRFESISHKLKDADLLGIPIRIVVSRESIGEEGSVEVALRNQSGVHQVSVSALSTTVQSLLGGVSVCLNYEKH